MALAIGGFVRLQLQLGSRNAVSRKKKKTYVSGSASADAQALIVRESPAAVRLKRLQREQQRLLREIRRRRSTTQAVQGLADELLPELHAQFEPLRVQLHRAARELRGLFARLLAAESGLARRHQTRLRQVYACLRQEYDLAALQGGDEDLPGGEAADCADRQPDPDPEQPSASTAGTHSESSRARRTNRGGQPSADVGYSAARPDADTSTVLRNLFRRLVTALHPDKVQDEGEKVVRTDVMKAVTQAYESGDVARMFELERSWLASPSKASGEDSLEGQLKLQLSVNKELREQLRQATETLKALRASLPISIDLGKSGGGREAAREELQLLLRQAESEVAALKEVRNRVRDFVQGRTDLATFLAGLPEIYA